ncbi:DUF6883 domain-containing protein [Methylobacterium aquaticum]|uniref:DUF6883 domain-containing protein n=1 Tax=Methylobacterium aquaticum TaxID=270351 RepID=UPI00193356BA|nr:DUF6883 domain-containing protein [Methylobacterium aquaticum]QRE75338.1 hypothetical protein F1D61_18630 [Methylobacterium aquaticum]
MSIKPGVGGYLLGLRCDKSKIKLYLMSSDPGIDGKGKRAFFESFGFSRNKPDELMGALLLHGSRTPIDDAYVDRWGEHWECTGPLLCPDGRLPTVRTVWIRRPGENDPTLVTAVPD